MGAFYGGNEGVFIPSMVWYWYPKGNPFKHFVILTLPTTKFPILKSRPSLDFEPYKEEPPPVTPPKPKIKPPVVPDSLYYRSNPRSS